jgi:L-iditol 2-dehydrogenase
MNMRAAVLYDIDDIRIEERPIPVLRPGDVLVRTAASGVCSGDLMPWYVRKKAPFVFGHEPAGTVVAVEGEAATHDGRPLVPGDRIFAHHHAPCFACAACARGAYVHCSTWRATALDPGGMAEFFRVPRANVADAHVLSDGMPFVDASLVEPLACVVKSLRRAFAFPAARDVFPRKTRPLAGRTLYVIGAGVMGLMHVAVAAALGARVVVSDFLPKRLEVARALGAEAAVEPHGAAVVLSEVTGGAGADAVMCGPGTAHALEHAIETVAAGGTVVMFTPLEPGENFAFDQNRAYFRDVALVASYSCGPDDVAAALRLIAAGVVTAERLEARSFVFPDVEAAYDAMAVGRIIKAIVTFAA